jgi:hypothetical protein
VPIKPCNHKCSHQCSPTGLTRLLDGVPHPAGRGGAARGSDEPRVAGKLAAAVESDRRGVASGLRLLPTGAAAESGFQACASAHSTFLPARLHPPCPALLNHNRPTPAPC